MDKQKQIEEMEKETNKQWQRRDEYCLRIQKAMQYKGNCDHEDIPSILVEFEKEIKRELIPEGAVVLTKDEIIDIEYKQYRLGFEYARKETAEKFAELALREIKAISAKSEYLLEDESVYEDSALENILEKVKKKITEEV